MISVAAHASDKAMDTASRANGNVMGEVNYELPHDLGTLTMQIPIHWKGGRSNGVEALWIDQNGSPFKDNITLVIRSGNKVADSEALLDRTMVAMSDNVEHTDASEVHSAQAERLITFNRIVGGQEIMQTALVIYREVADKSYLLTLTHSRPESGATVNYSEITID